MIVAAASFALLIVLPVNFAYVWFALILFLNGIGMGLFASPSSAGVMNSLPPSQRGAGAGMVASLFAAFLGYNPMQTLLGPHVLHSLPASQQHVLTGRGFFPSLISSPPRGGKYHHTEEEQLAVVEPVAT
jgi:MFS family permease